MSFNIRIVRADEARISQRNHARAQEKSAAAEGLASFAQGLLFGFGTLVTLVAALWIMGAIGVPLSDDVTSVLRSLYTR